MKEKLEKCAEKISIGDNIYFDTTETKRRNCRSCNGYDSKCPGYIIIKEDCYGL